MDVYNLIGKIPVKVDLADWNFDSIDSRRVAYDAFAFSSGIIEVSTVFLGLDHNFSKGQPLLFETMVFGGQFNEYCERCSTWEEAIEQHKKIVNMVQNNQRRKP